MVALGALLVGRLVSGGSAATQQTAPTPGAAPQPSGLAGLLDRLTGAGHGDAVSSWVGSGQNAPIQPEKLGSALGQTTVSDLARSAGMSEQELLAHLSRTLPGVVDKLTPGGRIPNAAEVQAALDR